MTPAERAAIEARDAEIDTSPLWRGWEHQHPVIAQLVLDRRRLLAALRAAEARALPAVERLAVVLGELIYHDRHHHDAVEFAPAILAALTTGDEP